LRFTHNTFSLSNYASDESVAVKPDICIVPANHNPVMWAISPDVFSADISAYHDLWICQGFFLFFWQFNSAVFFHAIWAHFRRFAPETGLSGAPAPPSAWLLRTPPIPCAAGAGP
jgi:hypothetical protein